MTNPTLKEQIAEVGRELGMRKGAYPRFIARGTLTREAAATQLERLDAVYRTLKWIEAHRDEIAAVANLGTAATAPTQERR